MGIEPINKRSVSVLFRFGSVVVYQSHKIALQYTCIYYFAFCSYSLVVFRN